MLHWDRIAFYAHGTCKCSLVYGAIPRTRSQLLVRTDKLPKFKTHELPWKEELMERGTDEERSRFLSPSSISRRSRSQMKRMKWQIANYVNDDRRAANTAGLWSRRTVKLPVERGKNESSHKYTGALATDVRYLANTRQPLHVNCTCHSSPSELRRSSRQCFR